MANKNNFTNLCTCPFFFRVAQFFSLLFSRPDELGLMMSLCIRETFDFDRPFSCAGTCIGFRKSATNGATPCYIQRGCGHVYLKCSQFPTGSRPMVLNFYL